MKKLLSVLLILGFLFFCACADPIAPSGAGRADVSVTAGPDVTGPADPQDTETPPDGTKTVTLVMFGDVLLHEPITESGLQSDGSYNYDHLFANVKSEVESADLALINQEVILGGRELGLSGYPRFNGPFEVADAEAAVGFDVVLQATNHALDKGKDGLLNDINYYRTHHPEISVTGIYDSAEARKEICVREAGGIRIAVLNYTYAINNGAGGMPAGMPWAVAMLDEEEIRADFARAKEISDFIIVCPHWGPEYSHEVSAAQRRWAELFCELGAGLILGAHPHVIEPVEELTGPDGAAIPVFWSVGNFINSTAGTGDGVADRMVGAMAKVTLKRAEDGSVAVESYEAVPTVTQMAFGVGAPTTYFLSDYTESLAAENKVAERDPAWSLQYVRGLCERVLGKAWKK